MASKQTLHMNQGQGETSYARNSSIQNAELNRMRPLIEAAIADLGSSTSTVLPTKMVIADLGCSSGPNAIVLVAIAIEAIHNHCLQFQQPPPEVCVLLNDLPDNDFNTVVKSLVTLQQSKEPIIVTGVVPGSFYERLFTSDSLHLICSSYSLHILALKGVIQWSMDLCIALLANSISKALSLQAPEDLTRNQIPVHDINEHARHERLPMVLDAYGQQFRKDFTLFLELRAKELASVRRMVISPVGLVPLIGNESLG